MERNPRGKRWVFTWNNYAINWKDHLNLLTLHLLAKYLIAETEIAPGSGTPHIRFYRKIYWTSLAQRIPCYWDLTKGSELDNIKYCIKEHDAI